LTAGYYDHVKATDLACKLIPQSQRESYKVFDMGCGTGLVGEEM
jgi:predicted TPR repeat methyltransferase